ncbi:MAG: hypothetical protein FJY80_13770 [Candidatus Aminicenantes bacterium]|nr:hypothetical protein [Candidatus Aminicenantes bacterium]
MRNKGLSAVLVLAVALPFAACQKAKQPEPVVVDQRDFDMKAGIPEDIAGKLALSQGIDRKWPGLKTLAEKVREDLEVLRKHFARQEYEPMAALLGARFAVVSGKNYDLMYGRNSADFWKTVDSSGVTLNFVIASVYTSNAPGPHAELPVPAGTKLDYPREKKVFDAVAFVGVEIHVVAKTGPGGPAHNDTYFMELAYPHRWNCPWEY